MNKKKIKVAILYDNYNDWIKKKYIKNKFLVKNFNLNMKFHDLDSFRKLITAVK